MKGIGDFSIDPPSYQEVSRLLKNSFSRKEKHRYECNQVCNTTKDPNIILNSTKTSLNNKKFKHINPKIHTHTKQV